MGEIQGPQIWNRETGSLEQEKVFGGEFLTWLYGSKTGRFARLYFFRKPLFTKAYGYYQDLPRSAKQIPKFITEHQIRTEEFEAKDYQTFNEYFIRRFKDRVRPFEQEPSTLPAFAEGRYFAFEEIFESTELPIKGMKLNLPILLRDSSIASVFEGGPAIIARLAPADYHRFHFPDDGRVERAWNIPGVLDSVHPIALNAKPDVFLDNERTISILETKNFGRLLYVEVGAICVGRIVQTHSSKRDFRRAQEKGYFMFGGSTVLIAGEPGAWRPDQDILDKTREGVETFVKLGTHIGKRP